jgi:O-antigen ligase
MSKKVVQIKSLDKKAVFWVGLFLFAITIYFNSKAQDPFNAPKFWVLLVGAAWLLGYLISYLKSSRDEFTGLIKNTSLLALFFIAFSTISLFASDNSQIALFGDNMRKNGFLTYLALITFFLTTAAFTNRANFIQVYKFMLLAAYAVGGYGLLQITGNDFIPWSASGMAIFSTLGNSNFAGSAMAILAIVTLGGAYVYRKITWILVSSIAAFALLMITIFPTNARQGLLLLFFGIGALAIVLIYNYNRILGRIAIAISAFGFVAAILGMLQIGPLERLLYKDSVSVRGYYWRAGISMLQDNLWFGVGLDNYGTFFKQYREVGYPLKYGYSLTSTNAHNVFIQHFATGGIFVGIAYLMLTVFIFWRGLKSMKNFQGDERFFRSVFFIAWLAFQGQSLISIDNIGISIWGWVLGGVVIALSKEPGEGKLNGVENQKVAKRVNQQFNLLQPTVSVLFGSLALVLTIFLQRGESAVFQQRAAYNPAVPAQKEIFFQLATKTINTPLIDLQNKVLTASYLHGMGYKTEAIALLEDLHAEDPNSLDTLTFLSSYYEMTGEINKALAMREKIAVLDPWNANNYLQMAFNYKYINDDVNKKVYFEKAFSFAPNDENVIKAKLELEL